MKQALLSSAFKAAAALRHRPSSAVLLAAAILFSGCAYFNTYYNAKKFYDQAGRDRGGFPDTAVAGAAQASLYQKSMDKFATVVAKYPSSRWAAPSVFHMAEATFRRGEYPKAQGLYEDVWHFYPSSKYADRARLGFAMASWRMGEHERAKRMLASIPGTDRRLQERASFLSALVSQSMGDMPEAALQWESFLYQNPKSSLANQARFNRAQCLTAIDDVNAAIAELELLLARRQRKALRTKARLLLASALERTGRTEEAMDVYRILEREAVEAADQRAVELSIARLKASAEGPETARSIFRQVAARHPRTEASAGAYYQMAELWEQENVMDSARAYYTMARQESPGSPVAEEALRSASDIAMLQALGSQAADEKDREQNAAIQFLMAEHYLFQLNQPDQAVEKYDLVSSSYPELPVSAKALYASAWVRYRSMADTAAADSIFSLLVERYPLTRYANAARERLGLPVDTLVSDQEPDITLATPISISIDTARTPAAPDSGKPETGTKIPAPPGVKPEPPEEGQGKGRMQEDLK